MPRGSEYSCLHHMINDSVHPYTESEVVSLTKEQEKELLASLSQILKQVQLWIHEPDSDSNNELETHSDVRLYLSRIIGDMVFLLSVQSQFVQHLAANTLVVIFEFLSTSGSYCDFLIRSLCCYLELAVTNISSSSSSSSAPLRAESGNSHFHVSSFVGAITPRLKNSRWSSLAGIVQVLRNISKCLKQDYDYDDSLTEVFLHSVHSCLSNVAWDSLDVICGTQSSCSPGALDLITADEEESKFVFLGNFIQFLCSLVQQVSPVDDAGCSLDKHPILCVVTNLVPKLLYWCFGEQGELVKTRISQYFRHKLVVLMIRLSFQARLDCCILASWLQLLHDYFEELLQEPMTQAESVQDDCLEGSPFLLSFTDGEKYEMCSRHLQRQVVFLFLRCSFTLISLREDTKKHCAFATADSCLTFDLISDLDCCGRKKGLLELYTWLQGHLPLDKSVGYEMYMETCMTFSLSFLQLYMHEDDILFKMLLELLNISVCGEQKFDRKHWRFQDVKEDIIFHLSNLFNPVHLFHLFLAELHYDHQVLLDYLISKDTGIHCAEYLLRCLRVVCDSWPLFKECSIDGKAANQSFDKRRKVILDCPKFQGGLPCATLKCILPSLQKEFESNLGYDYDQYITKASYYKEAKACLLSLKTSVDNLHQKNLFLYNPEVLLKRLSRFQELCSEK